MCVRVTGTVHVSLHTPRRQIQESDIWFHSVLTAALIASEWITSGSGRFATVTHVIEGWMPPDSVCTFWRGEKSLPLPGNTADHAACSVVTVLTELSQAPTQ